MYNTTTMNRLIAFIQSLNGIADKNRLAEAVKKEFMLTQDRKVYSCDDFAIRFSKSESKRMSNTVLSLSALQKYDDKPFVVCIVSSHTNYLLLANSTFLKKIRLYAFHLGLTFQDNLERLVESTNGIVGRIPKYTVTESIREQIMESIPRAQSFIASPEYQDLKADLDNRVAKVQGEIAIAAFIDNVNVRGRIIEYLITDNGSSLKTSIIDALNNKKPLPEFKTEDKLGDYSKEYPSFYTETDIKTKVLFLDGNPKAYNIDKLLEFLASQKAVYMIYLLGVDEDGHIVARLCSSLDERLIAATNIQHHWAGRNTRGVTQFVGHALKVILDAPNGSVIDDEKAKRFIDELISR